MITPNAEWGGEGSLGCDIGYGLLHRIPNKPKNGVSRRTSVKMKPFGSIQAIALINSSESTPAASFQPVQLVPTPGAQPVSASNAAFQSVQFEPTPAIASQGLQNKAMDAAFQPVALGMVSPPPASSQATALAVESVPSMAADRQQHQQ